jgi:L-ribulokinase
MNDVNYVIGVDYGTDSVRSVLVDASNGKEISSAVFLYPRWEKGLYCNPSINQFRQHPLDYIEGLTQTIKSCLEKAGGQSVAKSVRSITVDTTGSTPIAVDETGTPL